MSRGHDQDSILAAIRQNVGSCRHYAAWLRGRHAGYRVEDRGYDTACWMWQGGDQGEGYGRMSVNRRNVPAHRAYYEQVHGPIPDGLTIDHLCKVPGCVNPDHMEPVTFRENRRRSVQTILTAEQVRTIKAELAPHIEAGRVPDGLYATIAARYGVAKGTIRSIRKGGSWRDVVV
jgi:HNH endonuclease